MDSITAVYRLREDGDWDFMASFAVDEYFNKNLPETYTSELRKNGEEVLVKTFPDSSFLVDTLTTNN